MIVIDLGCHGHGMYDSVGALIGRFQPELLYGFDPMLPESRTLTIGETRCLLSHKAAWVHGGHVGIEHKGTGTQVYEDAAGDVVCFDLAQFIRRLPAKEELVLKLDVEGSEYPLLEHLSAAGLDERLTLALVEWHGVERVALRCPVEEWWM